VPGIIQQALPGYHGVAWFWHTFGTADGLGTNGAADGRVFLRFGAVDYLGEVWLNSQYLGAYEGGETPFEFDVTDAIRWEGDNLLAVRVLNPTNTPIDGYALNETPHRNKVMSFRPGSTHNVGGITYPVTLRLVPAVHIRDVFVRPDPRTGDIAVSIAAFNSLAERRHGEITLAVGVAADGGDVLNSQALSCDFPIDESIHAGTLHVRQPRLWNLGDPFLYRLMVTVQANGEGAHARSLRVGFRELRVVDGYFHLNGQRIFLKSTHTGNHMPVGVLVPVNSDFARRDLVYAKASGFNMVRFISGTCYPEQLDLCDELGLMVYEESLAAWNLADSPHMAERFDRNTGDMIRRDRNHACVTIWGLLNETPDNATYRHAVSYLPMLRTLDPTRLVLLSSGRWDEAPSVGSVSNPGSSEWEHVWGVESLTPPPISPRGPSDWTRHPPPGYVDRAGDAHVYPQVPLKPEAIALIKQLGHDTKPVFLSEFGIGSLQNVIGEWRHWEQTGEPALEEGAFLRRQVEMFQADWKRLGFDDVYPFPEDALRESQRLHARQRTLGFDLIRANPHLNGYNLTGMLDHALTGEGLWTFFREWKPGTFDAVADGWSPLRWCLLADATHVYTGQAITLEASLANEMALKPGDYPARFRVMGPQGVAWEKSITVIVPDPAPLAVPVMREIIRLDGPAGTYTFAANLERGGAPTGGRLKLHLSDRAALPRLSGRVSVWGIEPSAERWLDEHGLMCQPLPDGATEPEALILVGLPPESERTSRRMADLTQCMGAGATAIFLNAAVFSSGTDATAFLPLPNRGKAYTATDWLYHMECVSRRHPVFDGLQGPGIMDWDYYGPVVPHEIYEGLDAPDEMIAASFAVGHHRYPTGYAWGLLIGAYRHGAGKFILSTPYILQHLGAHPAADRLMLNIIRHAENPQFLPSSGCILQ
jgi:hypothetical protein